MSAIGSHDQFTEEADEIDLCLDTVLTLSNGADRSCLCLSASVVSAFLALADMKQLPHPGQIWVEEVEGYADVNATVDRTVLYRFTGLYREPSLPLRLDSSAYQAVFQDNAGRRVISRWTITATILLLMDIGQLPACNPEWHADLKRFFNASSLCAADLSETTEGRAEDV